MRLALSPFACSSGDAMTPFPRAWTCSYVSSYWGKDKLFVAEISLSLAVVAAFQPLISEKGPRAYSLPSHHPIGPELIMLWLKLDMQEP